MAELVPSQSEQDYLKAIYHLTRGQAKERTGPAALAEWLGFSCPSATKMVRSWRSAASSRTARITVSR